MDGGVIIPMKNGGGSRSAFSGGVVAATVATSSSDVCDDSDVCEDADEYIWIKLTGDTERLEQQSLSSDEGSSV